MNGFYFKQFYIQYKSTILHYGRNLEIKRQDIGSGVSVEYTGLRPYRHPVYGACDYETTTIQIEDWLKIRLSRYTNPQIMNSITITPLDDTEYQGIVASNLHPKNYQIRKINSTRYVKVKKAKSYKKQNTETFITPQQEQIVMLI